MALKEKVELNRNLIDNIIHKNELIDPLNLNSDKPITETTDQNDWFYALSHELRTPLNVILSTIQVSKVNVTGEYSQVKTRYLDIMKQNCLRLLKMVNNILEINRLDSGFYSVDLRNDDIVNVIREITLSVTEYAKMKDVELTFESNKPEYIVAIDSFQLERILLNLLSNAIKFTPVGGNIKVTVNIQKNEVFISVSDTGPGIPAQYQSKIFGKCIQTDGRSLLEKKGSGMGLYIVKRLLDNMNGKICAYNNKEKGATVLFSIQNQKLSQSIQEPPSKEYHNSRAEYLEIEFSDIYNH